MLLKRTLATILAVFLTVPASYARKPGEPIKPGWNLFSPQQDVQLGKEAAAQIRQQYQVVSNREVQDYINRIGKRLAATEEAGDFPYTFEVVNDPSINAFALPGGPTFIHTGLIVAADTEGQIAGVMGHELSHVALRHGTNQASKAQFMQLPAILAGAVTGSNIWASLANMGATGFMLKFSRTAEDQADALGARMMAKAGYNPIEAARFFEKLEAEGGQRAPQFLSSHPNPGNRVKSVEAEVRVMPARQYNADTGNLDRIKSIIKGLPAPAKKPGQSQITQGGGAAESPTTASVNVPRPSGRLRNFTGQGFALSHPDNWEVFGSRDAQNLTIAPRAGVIQGNQGNAIAYGAVIGFAQGNSRSRDLARETQLLAQQLADGNSGTQISGRSQRTTIDGSSALLTPLTGNSPVQGQREQNMLLTVQRPNGLFYIVFVAPQNDYRNYEPTFQQITRSLRFSN